MNNEGYRDPTAEKAVKNVMREDKEQAKVTKLMHAIRAMAAVEDFEIVNRVEFRNTKTGRVHR